MIIRKKEVVTESPRGNHHGRASEANSPVMNSVVKQIGLARRSSRDSWSIHRRSFFTIFDDLILREMAFYYESRASETCRASGPAPITKTPISTTTARTPAIAWP